MLGDSLTAGLGLSMKDAYPTRAAGSIKDAGLDYTIVNAGVSGDTSAGGLSRLDWALDGDVRVLIVALGGNDGLRGLPAAELTRNLSTIIERAQARQISVVLAGMEAPPNHGFDYTAGFHKVYPALAKKYGVALVPFLLQGVGGIDRAEPARWHPPDRRGCANGGRQRVDRPQAGARGRLAARRRRRAPRPMIELRDVSKTVMSGTEPLTILHPLSMTIARGRFLAIVGPSGSGKSTLLGLIAGLDAPTSGSVLIDGVDITRLDEDRLAKLRGEKIGFVFQFFHLIPSLTAVENVSVPMEIIGLRDARQRAEALLEEVGLTGRAHHYPSQLSGGEQQRVALARALANAPPIVLADEPTGNLDTTNGRHIMELLRTIHERRGTTVVLVTHDAELASLADTRLVLRDGRVVETVDHEIAVRPWSSASARAVEGHESRGRR